MSLAAFSGWVRSLQSPETDARDAAPSAPSRVDGAPRDRPESASARKHSAQREPIALATGRASESHNDAGAKALPHPIGDERARLVPPWATVSEVRAALTRGQLEEARSLLKRARESDAHEDEWRDFYDGLELIADCLEAPDARILERARAFMSRHRASPLRRHVRRSCLPESATARR